MILNSRVKIMVFGTFDVLHEGHLHFLAQAKKLSKNPFLIVSVARDKNVKKIKGHLPLYNQKRRIELLKSLSLIDKVVLGGLKNHLPHIAKEKPQIIALGYDQKAYTKNLRQSLKNRGLLVKVVTLKPHKAHLFKSSKLKNALILSAKR